MCPWACPLCPTQHQVFEAPHRSAPCRAVHGCKPGAGETVLMSGKPKVQYLTALLHLGLV